MQSIEPLSPIVHDHANRRLRGPCRLSSKLIRITPQSLNWQDTRQWHFGNGLDIYYRRGDRSAVIMQLHDGWGISAQTINGTTKPYILALMVLPLAPEEQILWQSAQLYIKLMKKKTCHRIRLNLPIGLWAKMTGYCDLSFWLSAFIVQLLNNSFYTMYMGKFAPISWPILVSYANCK